jgi:hypothetical protein
MSGTCHFLYISVTVGPRSDRVSAHATPFKSRITQEAVLGREYYPQSPFLLTLAQPGGRVERFCRVQPGCSAHGVPSLSKRRRVVRDHEVRAAALRHPADEANDAVLRRQRSKRGHASTNAPMRRAASFSPRPSSGGVAVPAKLEREPNEQNAVNNGECADDRYQCQRTGRGPR